MRAFLTIALFAIQIVVGILAFLAFTDLLESWGWPFLIRAFSVGVAFLIVPFLITPLGVWGAIAVWHWPWWQAIGIFMWPLVVQLLLVAIGGAAAAGVGILGAIASSRRQLS